MSRVFHDNTIPMNGVVDISLTKEKFAKQHLLAFSAVAL